MSDQVYKEVSAAEFKNMDPMTAGRHMRRICEAASTEGKVVRLVLRPDSKAPKGYDFIPHSVMEHASSAIVQYDDGSVLVLKDRNVNFITARNS